MPNPVLFSSQSDEEIAWNDNRNQGNQNQKHQTLKQGTSGAVGANNDLHELHMVLYATSERGLSFLPLFACPTFVSARSCKKMPPSLDEWKSLPISTPSTLFYPTHDDNCDYCKPTSHDRKTLSHERDKSRQVRQARMRGCS